MQTPEKNCCQLCQQAKGFSGNNVQCAAYGLRQVPSNCAAQVLTCEGWELAAAEAKKNGDMATANEHWRMAIKTQKAVWSMDLPLKVIGSKKGTKSSPASNLNVVWELKDGWYIQSNDNSPNLCPQKLEPNKILSDLRKGYLREWATETTFRFWYEGVRNSPRL